MRTVSPPSPTAAPARFERGMTMIELLVVMAIMAVLLGGGIGAFLALTSTGVVPTAQSRVSSFIQTARRSADGNRRATVVIESVGFEGEKRSQVRGLIQKESGLWHCEDLGPEGTTGAFRRNAVPKGGGAELLVPGKVGNAIQLRGGWLECGSYADFDLTDGIFVETWIRPSVAEEMTIAEKGGSWRFWLVPAGADRFHVHLQIRLANPSGRGTTTLPTVVTERPMVRVGRWSEVSFSYDGQRVLIHVDRIERAVHPERPDRSESEASDEDGADDDAAPVRRPLAVDRRTGLTIGSPDRPLDAAIDEFRIAGVRSEDVWAVPGEVFIEPVVLHFKDQKLDSERHAGPVTIRFRRGRQVLEMTVGLSGAVIGR